MRLAVANDTHFHHCQDKSKAMRKFVHQLNKVEVDALLFTGDISDGDTWTRVLPIIRKWLGKPVYYVLGNHDFYHWGWRDAWMAGVKLNAEDPELIHLASYGALLLDERVGIVGSSSVACLTAGTGPLKTGMWENISDFKHISELSCRAGNPSEMIAYQTARAIDDEEMLVADLNELVEGRKPKRIIVATHVAPFEWSALWRGQPTDPQMLPFYVSLYLGRAIEEFAKEYPETEFICLHGHTHGSFRGRHPEFDNIMVMAGEAQYGRPSFQMVLDTTIPFCGAHTA
jgi:predicted phosphodiesterase